jgi:hypothetical protein
LLFRTSCIAGLSSTARRPHKSPAHTVKDPSAARQPHRAPADLSSQASRTVYIGFALRQQPGQELGPKPEAPARSSRMPTAAAGRSHASPSFR